MGSRKSTEKDDLEEPLLSLQVQDLRFLCALFRLPLGRSKADLVETLLDSEYSAAEFARPVSDLLFGLSVEAYVPKDYWAEILDDNELPSSGSRHDLLLLLIENGLLDPRGTLEILNPSQLRDVFYDRFNRVFTGPTDTPIRELLDSFGFRDQPGGPEVPKAPNPAAGFVYDIAISFAGEDRPIATQIASRLQARRVRVFTDDIERTQLWGRDLSDELRSRYGKDTRYVLLLVSRHFAVKDWTDFEFSIARKEAGTRTREFILPVRLDDTLLPGLRTSIVYLSFKELGVDGIVEAVIRKLKIPQ